MPPSHEKNPENTPGEGYRNQWGEDLIWSWRANTHSVFKNDISQTFGWEQNHEEIVRVPQNHWICSKRSREAEFLLPNAGWILGCREKAIPIWTTPSRPRLE